MSETLPDDFRIGAPVVGWRRELAVATVYLTRVPLRLHAEAATLPAASSVRVFPVIGIGIGLVGGAVFALSDHLGMSTMISALLAIGVMALLTGGLHEDGLADTVDGLAGGRDRAEKLAIMRDGRIGAAGALALIVVVLLRAEALSQAGSPVEALLLLVAAAAGSRATLPAVMFLVLAARREGQAAAAGRPDRRRVVDAGAIGVAVTLLCLQPIAGAIAVAAAAATAAVVAGLCRRQLGGFTGDTLGAVQQGAEVAILLSFLAAPPWPGLWLPE